MYLLNKQLDNFLEPMHNNYINMIYINQQYINISY